MGEDLADGGTAVREAATLPGGARVDLDWSWLLDGLGFLRLRFRIEPLRRYSLPEFPGSTLRGALGHALKATACVRDHGDCGQCDLVPACAYPQVFEPVRSGPGHRGTGPAHRPAPYVLEWDLGAASEVAGPFTLDVLLIGRGAAWAPAVVPAIARAAAVGLGAARVPYRLLGVTSVLPDGEERPGLGEAEPLARFVDVPAADLVTVHLLTPLRLRDEGALKTDLDFSGLVRAALRRARLLAGAWGDRPAPWIDEAFLGATGEVQTVRSDLHWFDWTRHSNRQGTDMVLGGLVGEATFAGPVGPFLPLLASASVLHVGKGATFGLGRVAVEGTA